MGERGKKEEGGHTTAWSDLAYWTGSWGVGGFGRNFHQLSNFLKCGGLVATLARELFSIYLTHPLLRSFNYFRAPAGFCWTVR
jgi:hypothetical protein